MKGYNVETAEIIGSEVRVLDVVRQLGIILW